MAVMMVLIFRGFLLLLHGRCPYAELEKAPRTRNNSVLRRHDEAAETEHRPLCQEATRRADPTRHCGRDRKRRARTGRSEERRVGKECVSTCRSRRTTYHSKKNTNDDATLQTERTRRLDQHHKYNIRA